jgi:2,3-bisphosphoglycerate-independent phosphoglycerate mutase
MNTIIQQKFHDFKISLIEKTEALESYIDLLFNLSDVKKKLVIMADVNTPIEVLQTWIQ